jgi:hypothetical protein
MEMVLQILHWVNMAGTVLEGLLLVRILALKLQRVYTFVTLYWVVNLIFDCASWFFGWESSESTRLQIYGLFITALLLPLVAWDAFEEMKAAVAKMRMLHASRMVMALLVAVLLSVFWSVYVSSQSEAGAEAGVALMGFFLWMGSASVAALFLWIFRKFTRKENLATPRNTSVWTWLFLVLICCQFVGFVAAPAGTEASRIMDIALTSITVLAMLAALVAIRPAPTDVETAPQTQIRL